MSNKLFAIDLEKEEIIVSESEKGSNSIKFIERIGQQDNKMLYNAVLTLTCITNDANFNISIFKAMDKVCQLIYVKNI